MAPSTPPPLPSPTRTSSPSRPHARRCITLLFPFIAASSLFILAIHFRVVPPPQLPRHVAVFQERIVGAVQGGSRTGKLLQWLNVAPTLQEISPHPILPLLLGARAAWSALLTHQPTSLAAARASYTKRHALPPPPGYDQWYRFAKSRNFTLVDQFDGLMNDLSRYRGVGGPELRRRTKELGALSGVTLVSLRPADTGRRGDIHVDVRARSGRWAPGTAFKEMLEGVARGWTLELDSLPDASAEKKALSEWKWPQLEFAINERTEGRVLPRQAQELVSQDFQYLPEDVARQFFLMLLVELTLINPTEAVMADPETHPTLSDFTPEWGLDGNVWDAYRRACPSESAARRLVETVRSAEAKTGAIAAGGGAATQGEQLVFGTRRRDARTAGMAPLPTAREMTFLADLEAKNSFCDRPSTHHLHSAFFTDSRAIPHLYPLFSGSKPAGYADVLIPTHHHWSPTSEFTYEWDLKHGNVKDGQDVEWNSKLGRVYWRGKVTRGADTPPGHMSSFQKQRLVKLVSDEKIEFASSADVTLGEADPSRHGDTERVLVSLNATSGHLVSVAAPAKIVDPLLFDIAMACDPQAGECSYLKSLGYHVEPPAPIGDAWKHKLVLDLDEAGFSPRFGAVMESKSAVVKMSVQQEFWRDWIQPWYHFIPLSSSYAELHSLVSFFVGIPTPLASESLRIPKRHHHHHSTSSTVGGSGNGLGLGLGMGGWLGSVGVTSEMDLTGFDADVELKRIADAGRDWKRRFMRKSDMEVYMFRLMIEWNRLLEEPAPVMMMKTSTNLLRSNVKNSSIEDGEVGTSFQKDVRAIVGVVKVAKGSVVVGRDEQN